MEYRVYHSQTFDKQLKKYPKEFHDWLEKIEDQLKEKPAHVGDQLRVPWFREKKHTKFRIYYLIYEDLKAVYLVAISDNENRTNPRTKVRGI